MNEIIDPRKFHELKAAYDEALVSGESEFACIGHIWHINCAKQFLEYIEVARRVGCSNGRLFARDPAGNELMDKKENNQTHRKYRWVYATSIKRTP